MAAQKPASNTPRRISCSSRNVSAIIGSISSTENIISRRGSRNCAETTNPLASATSGSVRRLFAGSIAATTVAKVIAPSNKTNGISKKP